MLLSPRSLAAGLAPIGRKPERWEYNQKRADFRAFDDRVIFPLWQGAHAYYRDKVIVPSSIATFEYTGIKVPGNEFNAVKSSGGGHYNSTSESAAPRIDYPSALFDRSGINELTVVFVAVMGTTQSSLKLRMALCGNSAANDDGIKLFPNTTGETRWRIPENTNLDVNDDWDAGNTVIFTGRMHTSGAGGQQLSVFVIDDNVEYTGSTSNSTAVTFNEGTFSVGNFTSGFASSFPGSFVGALGYGLLDFRFWDDEELVALRHDWFAPLRPRNVMIALPRPSTGGTTVQASATLAVDMALSGIAAVSLQATATLAASAGLSAGAVTVLDAGASLSAVAAASAIAETAGQAALTLVLDGALQAVADTGGDVSATLAAGFGLSSAPTAALAAAAAYAAGLGTTATGAVESSGEGALTLGISAGQSASAVLTGQAAAAMAVSLAASVTTDSAVAGSVALQLTAGDTATAEVTIEGMLALQAGAGASASATAAPGANMSLAVQAALGAAAQGALAAGLDLAHTQSITITSEGGTLVVTTPASRTFTVAARVRTITVQ